MQRADLARLDGLARSPAAPESVLLRILTGAEGPVRGSVSDRDDVPESVCDAAVSHSDREVRTYLAVGRGASGAQRARLAADCPNRSSRAPGRLLELLDEPETMGAAAEGPALPLTAMEAILAAAGIP
ncbi:hypothetical protein [Streptomyces rubiginosohelvolus]